MAKFVVLASWTEQGVKAHRGTIERAEEFGRMLEKQGGRLLNVLWTLGEYDVVVLAEAPDDETMTALMLQLSTGGNVRTKTLRAFDANEVSGIIDRAAMT